MNSYASRLVQRVVIGALCGGFMVGPVLAMLIHFFVHPATRAVSDDILFWCMWMSGAVLVGWGIVDLGRERQAGLKESLKGNSRIP